LKLHLTILFFLLLISTTVQSKPRRPPGGGIIAVVVDERLSALRSSPSLSAKLVQRISRGRLVAIVGRKTAEEIVFYRVRVSSRTRGWIQREAIVSTRVSGDDARLARLIRASYDWDRIVRAHIFLDTFKDSHSRAEILLLLGDAAETAAARLSSEAVRRLDAHDAGAADAPEFSYFLNFNGLDRYNRQGVTFVFDRVNRRLHYNGAAWREIIRQYPKSAEAMEARKRLASLATWEGNHD
jgi:uncharacterized protein YgiM (DUF1202 family)